MKKPRILIVDDEESLVYTLNDIFRNYEVISYSRSIEALNTIRSGDQYDILLVDFRMEGIDGLALLSEAKKFLSSYKAVLITAFSSHDILKKGLNNDLFHRVVNKPFEPDEICTLVEEALTILENERSDKKYYSILESQIITLANTYGHSNTVLIHSCNEMKKVLDLTLRYASTNANVLIEGESGVGKEIIANLLHGKSRRAEKPLVKLNCSTIPENLFESELFGHKKGAFTGATADKPGKFQLANEGTLFLDEIGEMPLNQQSKLLRAIEDFEISPVGSTEIEKVNVRIVSATNRDLQGIIDRKEFRGDLHFRLNVLSLHIPPLRNRKQDIPLLSVFFLAEIANKEGQITKQMDKECLDYLSNLDFPGNVRELKNLIYKAYVSTEDLIIRKADIVSILNGSKSNRKNESLFDKSLTLKEINFEYIQIQLEKHDYSLTETARVLGIEVSNLSRKLKRLGISVKELKSNV